MDKNKQIEVDPEEQEVLRQFHEKKRKELLAQLAEHEQKMSRLNGGEKRIAKNQIPLALSSPGYDKKMSVPAKMKFVLREFNKCQTVRVITNRISDYEPLLRKDYETSSSFYTHVSSSVTYKIKEGKDFNRYKADENSDFKVGLREWFNEDGTPKNEYRND